MAYVECTGWFLFVQTLIVYSSHGSELGHGHYFLV